MKKRILFLDDDIFLRDSISSYLRSQSFIVDSIDTVQSALASINIEKPDLIIADIMMPYLDGYDFIRILHMNDMFLSIPFIFLTAKGMTSDRIKGYELGCSAYLTKPFNPDELVAIIHNLLKNIEIWKNQFPHDINKQSNSSVDNFINIQNFTSGEVIILKLVSQGLMNKEIAAKLNFSIRNVEKYVSRLLIKTNTRNRTELAQFFWHQNIDIINKGE